MLFPIHFGDARGSGALHADGGGGFCTTRSHLGACYRRVGPSCSAIPPFGGVEAVAGADVVPKSRPARRKTPKMGRCGRGGLHFGLNGGGQGVRARRGQGQSGPSTGGVDPSIRSYTHLVVAGHAPTTPATRLATQSVDKGRAPSGQGRDKP